MSQCLKRRDKSSGTLKKKKAATQTYVYTFDKLCELILLEELKKLQGRLLLILTSKKSRLLTVRPLWLMEFALTRSKSASTRSPRPSFSQLESSESWLRRNPAVNAADPEKRKMFLLSCARPPHCCLSHSEMT